MAGAAGKGCSAAVGIRGAAAQSLRDLWDADQASLQPLDQTGWTSIDAQIDKVLKIFGIDHPHPPMHRRSRRKN
ncbi:hypothetical protein [Streptomyces sp. NPDC001843]|uniref:hypothetical protein n=1 Tax=Streptomyces sp. NPDC001843 TaxID=3364617 RepID=UPI00369C85E9